MRKLLLFVVFSLAGFSVVAQQRTPQAPKEGAQPPAATQEKGAQESDSQWRERSEGVVSGVRPVPEREIEGVGAGAKPHLHFDQLDRGLHRRSKAEVIAPPSQ